ncbi:hypothetical protein ACP4OV_023254 [Aristida adscensionis]
MTSANTFLLIPKIEEMSTAMGTWGGPDQASQRRLAAVGGAQSLLLPSAPPLPPCAPRHPPPKRWAKRDPAPARLSDPTGRSTPLRKQGPFDPTRRDGTRLVLLRARSDLKNHGASEAFGLRGDGVELHDGSALLSVMFCKGSQITIKPREFAGVD